MLSELIEADELDKVDWQEERASLDADQSEQPPPAGGR
jgi:hypothetical protein